MRRATREFLSELGYGAIVGLLAALIVFLIAMYLKGVF